MSVIGGWIGMVGGLNVPQRTKAGQQSVKEEIIIILWEFNLCTLNGILLLKVLTANNNIEMILARF